MESIVVAKVDNEVWDLERPLEKDCTLKFLFFTDKEGDSNWCNYWCIPIVIHDASSTGLPLCISCGLI